MYVELCHLAATAGFCTLLWVVQLLVYPQFLRVSAADFTQYHQEHMRRITWVVGPLLFVEGSLMLVLFGKHLSMEPWLHAASAILFLAVTLQTFLLFVPLHRRLSSQNCEKEGENPGSEATVENDKGRGEKDRSPVIRRMIYLNWGRTLCQSARVVVALAIAA